MSDGDWSEPAYAMIASWVHDRTGLYFNPGRRANAEAGIARAMAKVGIAKVADAIPLLGSSRISLDDLVAELTVGETYFFRDPIQFDYIRTELLPQIRKKHGHNHAMRAWSAGCASGEEAYSLAILFEQENVNPHSTVLATDISRPALARARAAGYSQWSLRGDDGRLASHYFRRRGDHLVLAERFRHRVTFEYLNLGLDRYPSLANGTWGMDLILCRNVLIYFDHEAGRRVVRGLVESLADGGLLITGPSDPLYHDKSVAEVIVTKAGVFYRRLQSEWRRDDREMRADRHAPIGFDFPIVENRQPARGPVPHRLPLPLPEAAPPAPASPLDDPMTEARAAWAGGDYARVIALTRGRTADSEAALLHLHALANTGAILPAEAVAAEAARRHPLDPGLAFAHAMLLVGLDRHADAVAVLRRTIYLDRSLAAAHVALGQILDRLGDDMAAMRALRVGHELAAARPPDEIVPLTDGETAGRIAAAAKAHLDLNAETADSLR